MHNRKRLLFWLIGATLSLFLAWTIYTPIPFTFLKIASIACTSLLLLGVTFGWRYGKWLGISSITVLAFVALWPSQKPDAPGLRANYLAALNAYSGTPYVWGGENGRGIDCSGLMRRARIDALLSQGWKSRNVGCWREAIHIWWSDCSAHEMGRGYGGRIEILFAAKSLNALDTSSLRVGDLAVLKSGVHVLAFVGGRTWIQADPNLVNGGDKVIHTTAPSKNGWFGQRVVICRWTILD